ncbi:Dehydrin (type DHN1) [Ophiostoma piceae UAMH 11346]|uniref:Dehydrin (Type DHN1) n=1 Tax=Ophiostoma piceae (strain UAMH 11346) TaxID=1262450 RepID=S3C770_OPHP1|nr:Dehydrin (type DHN1) [Ophiostoma piceae UAMH 11346]
MGILHPDQRTYPTTATHGTAGGAYGEHPGVAAGTHIPTTQTTATGPAPNTAGPHRHDVLNKLDPSVDSDMSKVSTAAAAGTAAHTHNANTTHHNRHGVSPAIAAGVGAGLGGGAAHHHNHHNNGVTHGTTAPSAAYNNGGLGVAGTGHQNQYRQNQAVPVTGASGATGPARNTAGPHQSDMVNRLDPTVDSQTGLRR